MSADNYKPSLGITLGFEGGFVNHPKDPGGATNNGVTQAVYDAYRDFRKLPRQSVKLILPSEVTDIYNKNYWRMVKGDDLPIGLDLAVFDFAVNSGVSRANKYLQRLVGVADDGVIGMQTLSAVDKAYSANPEKLIAQYCNNRLAFVQSLKTFPTFGRGWTRRIIGAKTGVQANDNGIIDLSVCMAKRELVGIVPTPIGGLANETPGKSIAELTPESFVIGKPVNSPEEVKAQLVEINDKLAKMIAES